MLAEIFEAFGVPCREIHEVRASRPAELLSPAA
jgi:hypothetical protein